MANVSIVQLGPKDHQNSDRLTDWETFPNTPGHSHRIHEGKKIEDAQVSREVAEPKALIVRPTCRSHNTLAITSW